MGGGCFSGGLGGESKRAFLLFLLFLTVQNPEFTLILKIKNRIFAFGRKS
jgi:hypothetical protein